MTKTMMVKLVSGDDDDDDVVVVVGVVVTRANLRVL